MAIPINTVQQLQAIADAPDEEYELTSDINCAGFEFEPIASFTGILYSRGTFEGEIELEFVPAAPGYVIKNLTINKPGEDHVGLFGELKGGVYNIRFENSYVHGRNRAGTIAGRGRWSPHIQHCHVTNGVVMGRRAVGDDRPTYPDVSSVGGLIGENWGIIDNCSFKGSVSADVWSATHVIDSIGGLAGANFGTIRISHSAGAVQAMQAGFPHGSMIGGLVGWEGFGFTIERSYSTADVVGYWAVGGLAGFMHVEGHIVQCYARGSVTGHEAVGGLVGWRGWTPSIEESYSTGAVSGTIDVGGLVGYGDPERVTRSYWDTQTSGQSTSGGGEGKTTAEMKRYATFKNAGWDIGRTSRHNPNDGYPFLSWQVGRSPVWLITGGGGGWIPGPGPKPPPPVGIHGC